MWKCNKKDPPPSPIKREAPTLQMTMSFPAPILKPEIKHTKLFINNEWHNAVSGKTFDVFNPATGEVIAKLAEGDKADIDKAVKAAREVMKYGSPWRKMDASKRGEMLNKLADLIENDAVYLASLECVDSGKPYRDTIFMDVPFSAKIIRYYAGWADKFHGKTVPADGEYFSYTRLEPVGVCGAIIPWNGPMLMFAMKMAPALAAGNAMIMKPAELTPLTALRMAQLCIEAGFPPGVMNVVPGYGHTAGAALASHPKVDKIAFTGSTQVGQMVMEAAAKSNLKRVTLELGGKSPMIVFKDADLNKVVEIAHQGLFFNQGQVCCSATRIYVEAPIYEEFVARSAERARKRVVGNPFDLSTEQGPQVDQRQMNKILEMVRSGKEEGARLVCGGSRIGDKGYFMQPTIFAEVQDKMRIAREEIFGPVMQILKFDDIDDILERANDTEYGLAASIHTNDMEKIIYFSNGLKAGTVWVNCHNAFTLQTPFGGMKMSGIGREMGLEGILAYTETKTVTMKIDEKNS